ncbi:MAG: hypothetical protein RLZZ598_1494, partial [Pseudomonadota bacterium]
MRHLQHEIAVLTLGAASVLSLAFAGVLFAFNYRTAVHESVAQATTLMQVVRHSAAAAAYSGNQAVGQDAISGLLTSDVIARAELIAPTGDGRAGLHLDQQRAGAPAAAPIVLPLVSPFDDERIGELRVHPDASWPARHARAQSGPMAVGLVLVVFCSSAVAALLLRRRVATPLVRVRRALHELDAAGERRLDIDPRIARNEIGDLVRGFNDLLQAVQDAYRNERQLRADMEGVQRRLRSATFAAEQAAATKGEFLATMSHEIRTPISGVIGLLGFIAKDPGLSQASRHKAAIALSNAKALMVIINDVLDFSKLEAGRMQFESLPFDVRATLVEALAVFHDSAAERGLRFTVDVDAAVPAVLIGDALRLRQVLNNLVGNAIKFTRQGEVVVRVSAAADGPGRVQAAFAVRDSGVGIAAEVLPRLFTKYTQADVSTTRQFS